MHKAAVVLLGVVALVSSVGAGADSGTGGKTRAPAARHLPENLDRFYPPVANGPVYLTGMLDLQTAFSGIVVDLLEEDFDGARGSFGDFQRQYRKIAGMVPEWKREFPEAEVTRLGIALERGDTAAAMEAFGAVGEVCHRCHLVAMVPAQQRYRWGSSAAIAVHDPISSASITYPQFKRLLAANMAGIEVDLKQGQIGNARRQFDGFRERFEALRGSCQSCHEQPPRSFVAPETNETLEAIGAALLRQPVPAEEINALLRTVGRDSCSKCHLVHVPAALAGSSGR